MEFETVCYIIGAILFLEIALGVAMLGHGVDKILEKLHSLEIEDSLTGQVLDKMVRNEEEFIRILERLNEATAKLAIRIGSDTVNVEDIIEFFNHEDADIKAFLKLMRDQAKEKD